MAKGRRMMMKRQDEVTLDANATAAASNITDNALLGNGTAQCVSTVTVTETVTVNNAGATLAAGNGTDTGTKGQGKKNKGGKDKGGKDKGGKKKKGGKADKATEAATAGIALVWIP
jgi:hypothetical protein